MKRFHDRPAKKTQNRMTTPLLSSAYEASDEDDDQDVAVDENCHVQLDAPTTKVYKYRWVILLLFMISTGVNGFQWIQYSIISNVVQKYYSVQSVYVDWLSIIFMVAYLPFNFPALWLMDKEGLKVITVLGSALNCIAAWIKVVSVRPDLFYVTFIGQTIGGIAQVFTLNAPSRVAAVWFDKDQVSTACALAVFGNQVGVALGFLMPPIIVKNHDEVDKIGDGLLTMFYIIAGICTLHFMLVLFFFRAEPKLPPSTGQATRVLETPGFLDSLKRLSRNPGFVLLTLAYGINSGVSGAISTLLNQMILTHFPGHEEAAGRIGLTTMVSGMFGLVVTGLVLDKTHRFKETSISLYLFSMSGLVAFTLCLGHTPIGVIFGIAGILGFFMSGYFTVGFEFAAELTYPEPEGTTAGIMNLSMQVFGIALTIGASTLLNAVGDLWSNVGLCVCFLFGSICTVLIKADLKRQAAHLHGEDVRIME